MTVRVQRVKKICLALQLRRLPNKESTVMVNVV